MQINLRNSMGSEVHFVNTVHARGTQCHRVTAKGFADAKLAVAEINLPIDLHLPHLICGSVFQRRQLRWKRSLTWLIATRRHGHRQRFMRTHVIVTVSPLIKAQLHPLKVSEDSLRQDLNFQGPVKAFVFALSLRMIRSTVTDLNPQQQQPNRQRRVLMLAVTTPGCPIVHQHPLRQTIAAKSNHQLLLHGPGLFIAAGLQTQRVKRMIVQHSERMTALLVAQLIVTLKVHLPQLVRSLLFKSLTRAAPWLSRASQPLMPPQNLMDCALGQRALPIALEARLDLARPPNILIAHRQHLLLQRWWAKSRRVVRTPRLIGQPLNAILSVSSPPFVASFAADAKPLTQLAEIAFRLSGQGQKLLSQSHGRTLLPRHVSLLERSSCHCPMCYPCLWTPVTYVSGTYRERDRRVKPSHQPSPEGEGDCRYDKLKFV